MKKTFAVILTIIMLTSVAIATSIFAWYRANTSSKADVEHITTVNKTVKVTMMVKGDVVNDKKVDETNYTKYNAKTIAPEKGFYPIVPKEAGKFLYNRKHTDTDTTIIPTSVWQMGANNKVVEISSKNDKNIKGEVEGIDIGKGQRTYSQMDNITIPVDENTDRIFYPTITIADNEFSNGLSCALFAVDTADPTKYEVVAYSDYYFGYSPVSKRSSKLTANANAFVIQKTRTIQMTLLTWLDASKADSVNIYREASVTVELNNYDNIIFDNQGNPYREHYTEGFTYGDPSAAEKDTGLNSFKQAISVNANQTEVEHDENGNIVADNLITRVPSYHIKDGTAYPVIILTGKVAGVKRITIPQSVTTFPEFSADAKTNLEELILDGEFNISKDAFRGWTNLKKVFIGTEMLRIGQNAFRDCTGITEITMEGGTYLEQYCFAGTQFEEISLPYTIKDANTSGNTNIFDSNVKLRRIFIDCLASNDMFKGCTGLEEIIFGPSVTFIPSVVANNCTSLKRVIIGDNVVKIGGSNSCPFIGCTNVKDLTIGKSAAQFSTDTFKSLTNVENLTLPGSAISQFMKVSKNKIKNLTVTTGEIPANAFKGKTTIKTVTIQGDVTKIGASAFSECTGIERLNVLELGNWCKTAFGDANANPLSQGSCELYIDQKEVNELVIPSEDANGNPLTSISNYAFYNCDAIKSLKIPQSVTNVGADAFTGCVNIYNLVTTATAVSNIPFGALKNLEIVDKTAVVNGNEAAIDSTLSATITAANLETLKIGRKVDASGADFTNCTKLAKATVPATALGNLPASVTDLTVLSGAINSVADFTTLNSLRIEEGVTGIAEKFNGKNIVSLAVTAGNLNLFGSEVATVKHLEIIDTLSNTQQVQIADTSSSAQETVTRIAQTPVEASIINNFTGLESIKISDYTTIQGKITIGSLKKAIVSGSRIGEILGATNTNASSTINNLEVVSGTITQIGQGIPATGFSFWRGITNATLTIKDGVIVEDGAFFGCNAKITTATIPANAINPMLNDDYQGAYGVTDVTITSGNIPDNAFDHAPNIESLVVLGGVTGVGESAFDTLSDSVFKTDGNVKYLGYSIMEGEVEKGNPYHIAVGVAVRDDAVASITLNEKCKYVAEYAFAGTLNETTGKYSGLANLATVTIPSTTRLTDNAFLGTDSNITTITAPASALPAIPKNADGSNDKLTTLTVNGGALARQALANFTKLQYVTLGSGVTTINDLAFENCTSLDHLTIENEKINIASNAFEGCLNIHKATMPASVTKYIPKNELVEVTITSGEIEEYAFANVGLVKITLQSGVTAVKYHAFDGCNTVAILDNQSGVTTNLPAHKAASGNLSEYHSTGIVIYNNIIMRYVGNDAKVTVANTITEIGQYAFYNRDKVDVDFSGATALTKIGNYAFYGCEAIKKLILPKANNTTIGDYAFYRCTNLYEANMPGVTTNTANTEKEVGDNAFYGCGRLISVNAPNVKEPEKTSSHLFDYVPKDNAGNPITGITINTTNNGYITYKVGSGDTAYDVLLSYYGNEEEFSMLGKNLYVKEISPYAFYNQNNLKKVVITPSVEVIGNYAFVGCVNLEEVTFGNQTNVGDALEPLIATIGDHAFSGCAKLKSFSILKSVTSIGEEAFADCKGLGSVTFEEGCALTTIKDRAFMRSGITSMVIPASVETVGVAAFYKCDKLQSVTIGSGVTSIGAACFFACYSLNSVTFNDGIKITEIGVGVFDDCVTLTTITLPTTVTAIGNYAFDGCLRLTEVVGEKVASIGTDAFHNCQTSTVSTTAKQGENSGAGVSS